MSESEDHLRCRAFLIHQEVLRWRQWMEDPETRRLINDVDSALMRLHQHLQTCAIDGERIAYPPTPPAEAD